MHFLMFGGKTQEHLASWDTHTVGAAHPLGRCFRSPRDPRGARWPPPPGTQHAPDHRALLHQRQELRPPGVAELLIVQVEAHGERQVCPRWGAGGQEGSSAQLSGFQGQRPRGGRRNLPPPPGPLPFSSSRPHLSPQEQRQGRWRHAAPVAALAKTTAGQSLGPGLRGAEAALAPRPPAPAWEGVGPGLASWSSPTSCAQARTRWEGWPVGPDTARDGQLAQRSGNYCCSASFPSENRKGARAGPPTKPETPLPQDVRTPGLSTRSSCLGGTGTCSQAAALQGAPAPDRTQQGVGTPGPASGTLF